jgi:hypothetical protein
LEEREVDERPGARQAAPAEDVCGPSDAEIEGMGCGAILADVSGRRRVLDNARRADPSTRPLRDWFDDKIRALNAAEAALAKCALDARGVHLPRELSPELRRQCEAAAKAKQLTDEAATRKWNEDRAREAAEKVARLNQDPTTLSTVLSARICSAQKQRANTVAEIATQRSYTRKVGGVVDLSELYDLQQRVRGLDRLMAEDRAALSRGRSRPRSCGEPKIRRVAACVTALLLGSDWLCWAPRAEDHCDAEETKQYVDLLDAETPPHCW